MPSPTTRDLAFFEQIPVLHARQMAPEVAEDQVKFAMNELVFEITRWTHGKRETDRLTALAKRGHAAAYLLQQGGRGMINEAYAQVANQCLVHVTDRDAEIRDRAQQAARGRDKLFSPRGQMKSASPPFA